MMRNTEISLISKFRRVLWAVIYIGVYRLIPTPFHRIRVLILNAFGAKVHRSAHPYPFAKIWAPWNLELAEGSCIANYVDCYNVGRIVVGKSATVSQYSFLCTASHDYNSPSHDLLSAPIHIEDGAWVAADVFVAPGVTIGRGAVVLARSSVFKDIAAGGVAKGNPAKVFKNRAVGDFAN